MEQHFASPFNKHKLESSFCWNVCEVWTADAICAIDWHDKLVIRLISDRSVYSCHSLFPWLPAVSSIRHQQKGVRRVSPVSLSSEQKKKKKCLCTTCLRLQLRVHNLKQNYLSGSEFFHQQQLLAGQMNPKIFPADCVQTIQLPFPGVCLFSPSFILLPDARCLDIKVWKRKEKCFSAHQPKTPDILVSTLDIWVTFICRPEPNHCSPIVTTFVATSQFIF